MPLRGKLWAFAFNLVPAYAGTGAHIAYIADDWREVRVRVPLSLRTRNYHGTLFGGSIYGAVDPIYVLMLIKNLGPEYVVWDKSASIQFKRPGRSTLYARFVIEQAELDTIRTELETARSVDRVYHVDLTDKAGNVCATVAKTIYVRRKAPSARGAGVPLADARPA